MLKIEIFNFTNARIQNKKLNSLAGCAEKELVKRNLLKSGREYLIECSFVDEPDIRAINKRHRKKDKVTDVVSLSYFDSGVELGALDNFVGEIFICVPRAKEQSVELGHSFSREIEFLFVHGLLHIFGFDHEKPAERSEMFRLTDRILCD